MFHRSEVTVSAALVCVCYTVAAVQISLQWKTFEALLLNTTIAAIQINLQWKTFEALL